MKQILVLGAGKSSSALIGYLLLKAASFQWHITVIDASLENAKEKLKNSAFGSALSLNIEDKQERINAISNADIVISLLPPHLHSLVARDCVSLSKNLLTASYVDDNISLLSGEIKHKQLLFLCEMGLDPGIDHMSAMQLVNNIKKEGGKIISFKSHCGGLVTPESDDNPWHYKISWNPRNVVMAGKQGAIYKYDNNSIQLSYSELFGNSQLLHINGHAPLSFYPNRNSLSYLPIYDLEGVKTFVRTTLRYPAFMKGWNYIISLKLTDEAPVYETKDKSLAAFFLEHLEKNKSARWLSEDNLETEDEKSFFSQLSYLGLFDNDTIIDKGICSAADVLQFALEKKLALQPDDKDMIVMMHEIEYDLKGKKYKVESNLTVKGEDSQHTAMAKTVGLPLGIAAMLILEEKITLTGLHIPILPEIYEPVLAELSEMGIRFHEITKEIS